MTLLTCFNNQLTELNGLDSLTNLAKLLYFNNQLVSLDLSPVTGLTYLYCGNNPITSFTAPDGKNLTIETTGTGSVIFGSSDPNASYNYCCNLSNKTVTLTADPSATFQGWTGLADTTTNPASFTLDTDMTVIANFPSSDATLKSLWLSNGTLSPSFDAATTSYTASVSNTVDSITITVAANAPKATVSGDGAKQLNVGSNPFTITVKAENGGTKTYTITITRDNPSGGGGGGSSSSSHDDHYIITTPQPLKPDNPALAVIELPVTVGSGTATGKPDDRRTAGAISQAQKDAKAKTNGIAVQYDAKTVMAYDGFSITIKRESPHLCRLRQGAAETDRQGLFGGMGRKLCAYEYAALHL